MSAKSSSPKRRNVGNVARQCIGRRKLASAPWPIIGVGSGRSRPARRGELAGGVKFFCGVRIGIFEIGARWRRNTHRRAAHKKRQVRGRRGSHRRAASCHRLNAHVVILYENKNGGGGNVRLRALLSSIEKYSLLITAVPCVYIDYPYEGGLWHAGNINCCASLAISARATATVARAARLPAATSSSLCWARE